MGILDWLLVFATASILISIGVFLVLHIPPFALLRVEAWAGGDNRINLNLFHEGGDPLAPQELEVLAENFEGETMRVEVEWGDDPTIFEEDEKAWGSYNYGAHPPPSIKLRVIHMPTGVPIYENDNVAVKPWGHTEIFGA